MTNTSLPIFGFRNEILAAVKNNSVVVITAETGAGKSTQVPQFLLEEGYNLVVTQPRRLAARTVAARVAQERGEQLSEVVGYRTAMERQDSEETRCLFCTDGLALVRELMGVGKHGVLVLDEVHEWNMSIEVLVAWAKLQISQGSNFKVVLMSATLEAEKLSVFFDGAPIISVPGRLFPVEERKPGNSLRDDAAILLQQGHNVLVFQPGKSEISALINDLKIISGLAAELLPLHGELSPEEQTACFKHYGRPKCVVSTNVAQTSVTIDDIDAVVDSGMERRIELVNGVEGLYLKPISFADAKQRKGRAGRTKAGVYIDHCPTDEKRLDFPKAEILRSHLDQTVLRLAEAGFDAEELDFFHQPNKTEIHEAKRALKALGCMDESGKVSAIGSRVAKMPVSVQYARMVVEAERLGVVDDVITVAAILEQGEITARKVRTTDGREVEARPYWLPLTNGEQESDVLAQLAIYKAALNMTKDELQKNGVFTKGFFQAKEVRRHLAESLRGKVREFRSSGKREDIMRALCAGMVDHLYQNNYGNYRNGDGVSRQLNRESVIREAGWLVGLPWDLQITTRRGTMTLQLIRMATKVNPMWLTEVAPQLVKKIDGLRPMFYPAKDSVVSTTEILFQGRQISNETISDPENPLAAEIFCKWLSAQMAI